jgi:hypothetical protein
MSSTPIPRPMRVIHHRVPGNRPYDQMRETVRVIGDAIKRGSTYLPIRNHAAAVATTAAPKDYFGQAKAIYDDFINRWRYVRDPVYKELVTHSPRAVWKYLLAGDGIGVGLGKGAGDCDCATIGIGSELVATGFPVRIATTSPMGATAGNLFGHVFAQAQIPGCGWVTVDPVLHPNRPFGATTSHSRIAYWDLSGRNLGYSGNVKGALHGPGGDKMSMLLGDSYDGSEYQDLTSYMGFGSVDQYGEPDDWSTVGLDNWGHLTPLMGIINGDELPMQVEVETDENGIARTPMIELSPSDYEYTQIYRRPYMGMLGLGDDGTVYEWEQNHGMLGGWWKRLKRRIKKGFRKIGKGIKKVAHKIKKGIKKVVRMLPGGKLLLKIAGKIKKVAMKLVKPLVKFVGKYASKLAPIAALIPGYGPAIAAGLHMAGKIAKAMNKYGVIFSGKKGKVRTLSAKDPQNIKDLQKELGVMAKQQQQAQQMKASRGITDNAAINRAVARSGAVMQTGVPYRATRTNPYVFMPN